MKILRLSGTAPRHWSFDLHPRITVVHGLPPDVASAVRAAIDALVQARLTAPELGVSGLGGRVLVDGDEIGLDALADRVPGPVPAPAVRGSDLVSSPLAGGRLRALDAEVATAEAAVAAATAAVEERRRVRDGELEERGRHQREGWQERSRAAAALRAARRRVADATAAATAGADGPPVAAPDLPEEMRRLASERVSAARAALDAARAARVEAEQELAAVASGSAADDEALRAELAELERRCVATAPVAAPTEGDRQALAERRAFLDADIDALPTRPTQRLADALAAAEADEGIPVVEAARVAVEWERVRDLVAEAEAQPAPTPPTPAPVEMSEAASQRLARAHDAVSAARRAVAEASGSSPLDPAEVEALEAAHAEVLSAWEGSEKRIGVGRARRRLEDAQLAEREILARMGFASYTEFMVSGRSAGMPSQLDAEEARRNLREAEARLAEVEADVEQELGAARSAAPPPSAEWDADAARGRLTATLAALRARAVDLLGEDPGDDVAGALRERISSDPLPDLRLALDEVGVPLGEVLSRDAVLGRARDWLGRADDADVRRRELLAARDEIDARVAELDRAAEAASAWHDMVVRRDEVRAALEASSASSAARAEAEERLVRDRADEQWAEDALAEAEADEVRITARGVHPAPRGEVTPPADTDVDTDAEADARDAQTALDVAVARLLPARPRHADDDPDTGLGRAEARLALARLELETLRSVRDDARRGTPRDLAPDVDDVAWRVMVHMARHRSEARTGGPGPSPLVIDEPFDGMDADGVRRLCEALAGPALAVQVILRTDRDDVAEWAATVDDAVAGLTVATAPVAAGA